jgi:hypoxanthine phosphoribosyltransferase
MTPEPVAAHPDREQPGLDNVLYSAEQIRERLEELAAEIARDYGRTDLIAIAILKGSFVFLADLARLLSGRGIHLTIDFMRLSSYGPNTSSSGQVIIREEPAVSVTGHPVLLIDDILDTGLTLQTARRLLLEKGATDVRTCVLLDNPSRRRVSMTADYVGFHIAGVFAVGYGLDHNHRYRHLPYLAALDSEHSAPDGTLL